MLGRYYHTDIVRLLGGEPLLHPDLLGIARPMNPGRYRVTVAAGPGRSGTGEVELKEGETKTLEVKVSP